MHFAATAVIAIEPEQPGHDSACQILLRRTSRMQVVIHLIEAATQRALECLRIQLWPPLCHRAVAEMRRCFPRVKFQLEELRRGVGILPEIFSWISFHSAHPHPPPQTPHPPT